MQGCGPGSPETWKARRSRWLCAGFAALPASFGRCDLGHLELASAAFFLGIATIEETRRLRHVWTPLALVFVLGYSYFGLGMLLLGNVLHPNAVPFRDPRNLPAGGESTLVLTAPCPVVYRTVTIWPAYDETPARQCLVPGFFAGTLDVLTDETMARKVEELTREPRLPLLMRAEPLAAELQSDFTETHTEPLRALEEALYLPPLRHAPLTYAPLIEAIEENYTPGPVVDGAYRVWTPKSAGGR